MTPTYNTAITAILMEAPAQALACQGRDSFAVSAGVAAETSPLRKEVEVLFSYTTPLYAT